jgi:cation:H+ antiporter
VPGQSFRRREDAADEPRRPRIDVAVRPDEAGRYGPDTLGDLVLPLHNFQPYGLLRENPDSMTALATPLLGLVFVAGAGATWVAGVLLSKATDTLDFRFGLGDELGGILLLAIAGSLPELAITVSAAASGHLAIAAGNLIGGIAVQTMVLVVCDVASGPQRPLTFLVGALTPVLEGSLVVLVVSGVLMGALLKPTTAIGGVVSPASLMIVVLWLVGVYVINRVRKNPRWKVTMPGSSRGRTRRQRRTEVHPFPTLSTARVVTYFGVACAVTLVAGVALEVSGAEMAHRAGIDGVIFGATVLAAATALPEVSSGIAAVRLGDNALAIGDVFGGNAFQICLFLLADLVAGAPVLPTAGRLNAWLAALGIALTSIYSIGIVARPDKARARLGPDSILAIVVFGLGIAGLFVLPP